MEEFLILYVSCTSHVDPIDLLEISLTKSFPFYLLHSWGRRRHASPKRWYPLPTWASKIKRLHSEWV